MGNRINLTPEELLNEWDMFKEQLGTDTIPVATNKGVVDLDVKKPYTKQGFLSYIYRKFGFHVHQYFDNYQNAYESYLGVVMCIRGEWEDDQITGTLTGKYKAPNLVARLNGLTDKKEIDHKGELKIPTIPDIGNRK